MSIVTSTVKRKFRYSWKKEEWEEMFTFTRGWPIPCGPFYGPSKVSSPDFKRAQRERNMLISKVADMCQVPPREGIDKGAFIPDHVKFFESTYADRVRADHEKPYVLVPKSELSHAELNSHYIIREDYSGIIISNDIMDAPGVNHVDIMTYESCFVGPPVNKGRGYTIQPVDKVRMEKLLHPSIIDRLKKLWPSN